MELNRDDALVERINSYIYHTDPKRYHDRYDTDSDGYNDIKAYFIDNNIDELINHLRYTRAGIERIMELDAEFDDIMSELENRNRSTEAVISSERPIVKLTGQPISPKLQSILDRLDKYEDVDIDEIMNTPEMILAESIVSKGADTSMFIGREDLRDSVLNRLLERGSISGIDSNGELLYNNSVKRGNRLDIVIGLPASGKSSALVNTIAEEFGSRIVDNDEAKKLFPEYNNGWGANHVHKESQEVSAREFAHALERGENIVLPKVGANMQKLLEGYVNIARTKGYSVNVHYVTLAKNKALSRMLSRFVEEGRYLSPHLIEKYVPSHEQNRITQTFDAFLKNQDISSKTMWSNDVGRGEKPILLFNDGARGKFIDNARMPSEEWLSRMPDVKEQNDIKSKDPVKEQKKTAAERASGEVPAKSKAANLADEIDAFVRDFDPYDYSDTVDDREANVRQIAEEIKSGNTNHITKFLQGIVDEGKNDPDMTEDVQKAQMLINKLTEKNLLSKTEGKTRQKRKSVLADLHKKIDEQKEGDKTDRAEQKSTVKKKKEVAR